jgi:integrase
MDSSGKRRRVVAYAADNESAKARLDEIKARPEVKARLPKAEGTVGKLIDDWLTNEVAANLRASTAATYRATFRKHIEPSDLAKVFLAKVRSTDVDGLYRLLLTSGVSSRTRRKVHDLLTSAFTSALEKRQIASDPMIGIKRPTYAAPSVKALGPKQIAALIEAAHGDRLEALYLVALFGGLREGELLALRWGDVDLKGGTIFVRASLQDTGLSKKKGGAPARVIAGTKTEGSERPVSLPKIAADALRRHRKLVARDVPERALVFPNDDGGPIWRQNLLRRSFYPLLKRAGLYADDKPLLTFHGLRHVHGTELFRAGIHPKIVQERLGHSRVQITLDTYSSSVPSLQGAAVQALDAAYPSRRRRASATRVATRNPQMGATPE